MEPQVIYHRDVYWPQEINQWMLAGFYKLKYTDHAKKARYDKYTRMPILDSLMVNRHNIVEYYPDLKKFTYRFNLNDRYDAVMVLMQLTNGTLTVITQWVNEVNDKHTTLAKEKYVQSPK